MSLIVLEPGIETRIVDLGRAGTRSLGVPVGGAADRRSLILGNSLIGNPPDAAALEIALKGPRLRAEAPVGCVLFGAPFEAHCDGSPIEADHSFTMHTGQELHVGGTKTGARAYLCVRGGFDVPSILASKSALQPIQANESLRCPTSTIDVRFCPALQADFPAAWSVSVLEGLQASWFDEQEFFSQTFTVTPASNRMGLRLSGKPLTMPEREMISEPVCPGSIQVTRDGQCIILGVDGQTIGGYPKIAQVIQADVDLLGQIRPGSSVRFSKVQMEEAIQRVRAAQADLALTSLQMRLAFEAFECEPRSSGSGSRN